MRIVSLLPSTTEILFAIGAGDAVVGVTFECDYPAEARTRRIVSNTALPHELSPVEIDAEVKARVAAGENLYRLDVGALRELDPNVVVTQDLCAVCAVDVANVNDALEWRQVPWCKRATGVSRGCPTAYANRPLLHSLERNSCLVRMAAGENGIRPRRDEVAHLDFPRTRHVDVDPYRVAPFGVDPSERHRDLKRHHIPGIEFDVHELLLGDHRRWGVGSRHVLHLDEDQRGHVRERLVREHDLAPYGGGGRTGRASFRRCQGRPVTGRSPR